MPLNALDFGQPRFLAIVVILIAGLLLYSELLGPSCEALLWFLIAVAAFLAATATSTAITTGTA